MATLTLREAMTRISQYLDKVAARAEGYMKSYVAANANKGYQTGALAASIDTQTIGDNARSVGTSLRSKSGHVYGAYVDKGRGPITKTDGYMQYYDPKLGRWVKTRHVNGMEGIGFIQATKEYIESTHIPL